MKVYNSLTDKKEEFKEIEKGKGGSKAQGSHRIYGK